jgi:ribosomal protein S14
MSIYGTKGKLIKGKILKDLECRHCGNRFHRSFGVLRYFHICRIPVFTISKKVGIECSNCRWTLLDQQIPERVRMAINSSVFNQKSWLRTVTGSVGSKVALEQ